MMNMSPLMLQGQALGNSQTGLSGKQEQDLKTGFRIAWIWNENRRKQKNRQSASQMLP